MSPRAKRWIVVVLVGIVLGYLGICLLARLAYPRLLFPAPRLAAVPASIEKLTKRGEARLLELAQTDGSHTSALYFAAPAGARTVVHFHGNGETAFDNVSLAQTLREHGLGVLLVEYRGYGITHGPPPSEAMLYEDAEAAIAFLLGQGIPEERIALWGTSLGSGVAAEMAKRGHGVRLTLVTPYTSIVDVGARVVPFLPARLIMSHRLDTLSKTAAIHQRTLVIHGNHDEIVPFAMGEAVAKALGASFLRVPGGHHNDLFAARDGEPSASELLDRAARHLAEP